MNDTDSRPAVVGQVESSAMQHTSDGPWVDAGLTGPEPRITGGPLRLVKCEGVVIAFMPAWLDDEHEEARANARLVAAAPDLLAALRDLEAMAERYRQPSAPIPDAQKKARAAIAKAVGWLAGAGAKGQ